MTWGQRITAQEVGDAFRLANKAGWWTTESKHLLFHDLQRLESGLAELKQAFPEDTLHAVAIKANPLIEVLRVIVEAGVGLEAASMEEVHCALAAGCPPDRIVFDSPAKTIPEIREALERGLLINADNQAELERIQALGPQGQNIGLRVNPAVGAGSIGFTSTVSASSKFGVPLTQAPDLIAQYPFVNGLHVHTGSQGCGLELLRAAAQAVAEVAEHFALDWLDVGGGLPVRYTQADNEPPPVQAWAETLSGLPGWGTRRLVTELGRSLQAGCGWAVSRIEAVKQVGGRRLYVTHLGADFLLRPVYRPGEWAHEFFVLDPDGRPRSGEATVDIAGPLCFAGDLIARDQVLPEAQPGDLLVIRDTGAYTLSMWSRHCSRGLPPVVGIREGELVPLFHGEQPEDVAKFWSL